MPSVEGGSWVVGSALRRLAGRSRGMEAPEEITIGATVGPAAGFYGLTLLFPRWDYYRCATLGGAHPRVSGLQLVGKLVEWAADDSAAAWQARGPAAAERGSRRHVPAGIRCYLSRPGAAAAWQSPEGEKDHSRPARLVAGGDVAAVPAGTRRSTLPAARAIALAHLRLRPACGLLEPATGALGGAGDPARGDACLASNLFGGSPGDISRACFHDTMVGGK